VKGKIIAAGLLAALSVGQNADAKSLEDVLKEKGVITEADYKEVTKVKPLDYKLGKGFIFTSADEKFQLSIGGRLITRYTFFDREVYSTTSPSDTSQFLLKKAQLNFAGYAYTKNLTYRLQMDLSNAGNNRMLEYAFVNYKVIDELQILAGQTKLPYSRQNLAASSNLEFVDVSLPTSAFSPGYDLGVIASGKVLGGVINYDLGVEGGTGQTTPRVGNNNAFLARLQFNPLGAFAFSEGDPEFSEKPLVTVGSTYYMNTLRKTGAATFETNNVGLAGTSGWLGSNAAVFNATEKVDINSVNIDAAFKWKGAFAQAEYFWGQGDGQVSDATVIAQGYYVQAGYCILPKKLELAMRYSYLDPNRNLTNNLQTEVIGAISYYFNNHNLKLQADIGNIHRSGAVAGPLPGQRTSTDDMQYRMQVAVAF